jgi:2'-5' RNA ligase
MDLYFIAVLPHLALRKEILSLKEEIFANTSAKKAINSPAHITIQRPFRRDRAFEEILTSHLELFAKKQNSFKISLSGFGCFDPRTIFVDVKESQELVNLHQELNFVLLDSLKFELKELNTNITPHVTIANRDLNQKEFYRVWPTYKNRVFNAEFTVKSIFLLKYNGRNWDIIQEFLFKN